MPGKKSSAKSRAPVAKIQVRGQRVQGTTRQYINQVVAISPPRISGSIDEKLAVLGSLGVVSQDADDAGSHTALSRLATAAGFVQLQYERKYPSWTSTDILD
jgi:hypothetical protein